MRDKRVLGAIIAGGAARRFGADKGAALLAGKPLITHVADALSPQCDAVVIIGRSWPGLERLEDQPCAGLGPLGGLNAALHYAAAQGFDAVLTAGCDTLPVPQDLATLFTSAPMVIAGHYLIGLWPVVLAAELDAHLEASADYAMRTWLRRCGAREVPAPHPLYNLNTPADLSAYALSFSSAVQP